MYDNGDGVPLDDAKAIKWYRLVAEQGNVGAQINLGVMYATGEGTPPNFVEAYRWLNLAVGNISDPKERAGATSMSDEIAAQMTPAQIAEAKKLLREWKPK